jgi:hypothetical protein
MSLQINQTPEWQWMEGVFRRVFRESPIEPVWSWADKNVWFSEAMAASEVGYNSALTPWTRDWQDVIRDPSINEVVAMKSSQSGFTEASLNVIRWMPDNFPGNAGYLLPDDDKAKSVSKIRLKETLRQCAEGQITENEHDFSTFSIILDSMVISIAGAGSNRPFRETWYRAAFLDEVEDHPLIEGQTSYQLIKSRFTTVEDYTLFVLGKPQNEGGPIHQAFCRGSQEEWHITCPHCQSEITFEWENFRYTHCRDLAEGYDFEAVEHDTWYQTQCCGGRINESQKKELVSAGRWIPRKKEDRLKLDGKYIPPTPGVRSFHFSDLCSFFPGVSWGKLAIKWITCTELSPSESDQDVFRKEHLGLPKALKVMHVTAAVIEALRGGLVEEVADGNGGYRRNVLGVEYGFCYDENGDMQNHLPVNPILLTVVADKQNEFLKYGVFAMQPDGQTWLVDRGRVWSEDELIELRRRPYYAPGSERPLYIYGGGIDCRFRPKEVFQKCMEAQRSGWALYPIRGSGMNSELRGKSYREVSDWVEGGRIIIYEFHNHTIESDFYLGTIQKRQHPRFWLPSPVPADITQELTSTKLISYQSGGRTLQRWERDKKLGPNDYGDICKIQMGVIRPLLRPIIEKLVLAKKLAKPRK